MVVARKSAQGTAATAAAADAGDDAAGMGWTIALAGRDGALRLRWDPEPPPPAPPGLESARVLSSCAWHYIRVSVHRWAAAAAATAEGGGAGGGGDGGGSGRAPAEGATEADSYVASITVDGDIVAEAALPSCVAHRRPDNTFPLGVGSAGVATAPGAVVDFDGLIAHPSFSRHGSRSSSSTALPPPPQPPAPLDARVTARRHAAAPFRTLRDLLRWAAAAAVREDGGGDPDALMRCWVPWAPRCAGNGAAATAGRPPRVRTLVCHDAGPCVYVEDAGTAGPSPASHIYRLGHWAYVDAFVYFSHALLSPPPPGWTAAAHANGALALGSIVVEWDAAPVAEWVADGGLGVGAAAAALAAAWGFDGWLVNVEVALPGGAAAAAALARAVRVLTDAVHAAVPHGLVLWYDGVTSGGELKWQSALTEQNEAFFAAADGLFCDYHWAPPDVAASAERARRVAAAAAAAAAASAAHPRLLLFGVDVWGRGTYGGGQWRCREALAAIDSGGAGEVGVALFAPAWGYEACGGKSGGVGAFDALEAAFWTGGGGGGGGSSINLVADSGGGGMEGWTVDEAGGDGWRVEDDESAPRVDPTGGAAPVRVCVTSYGWCRRSKCVDLWATGAAGAFRDESPLPPRIAVGEWVRGTPPNAADPYRLQVELRGDAVCAADGALLASYDSGEVEAGPVWRRVEGVLDAGTAHSGGGGSSARARWLVFCSGGRDAERWAGAYGARMFGAFAVPEATPRAADAAGVGPGLGERPGACALPLASCFCDGTGAAFWVRGERVRCEPWSDLRLTTLLPTYRDHRGCVPVGAAAGASGLHHTLRAVLARDVAAYTGGASLRISGAVRVEGGAAGDPRGARMRVFACDVPVGAGACRRLSVSLASRGARAAPVLWFEPGARCVTCARAAPAAERRVGVDGWRCETWTVALPPPLQEADDAAQQQLTLSCVGVQFDFGADDASPGVVAAVEAVLGELAVWDPDDVERVRAHAVTGLRADAVWEAASIPRGVPLHTVQLSWAWPPAPAPARACYWDVYVMQDAAAAGRMWVGRAAGPCFDVVHQRLPPAAAAAAGGARPRYLVVPLDGLGAPQEDLAATVDVLCA